MATTAGAASRDWTGAVNAHWSEPNNWSPAGTPQNGDSLSFGFVDDSHRSMVNDITDLSVESLAFANHDYQLDGNALVIDGTINNDQDTPDINNSNASHTTTINCPLVIRSGKFAGFYTGGRTGWFTESTTDLRLNGPLNVDGKLVVEAYSDPFAAGGNGHVYISGVVSGSGLINASCDEQSGTVSSVEFNGTPGNTFAGTISLETHGAAQIVFNKSSGMVITNRILITPEDAYWATANLYLAGPNQIGGSAAIEIDAGGHLILSGNNVSIGSLVLSNFSADALSSTLDTGSVLVGIILLEVAAVVVTFSRAGFLSLAACIVLYLWRMVRRGLTGWVLVAFLACVAGASLLPGSYMARLATITNIDSDPTGSAQNRWGDTEAAVRYVMANPLVGAGIGMDTEALNAVRGITWTQVHNICLEYAVDLALPGLALFTLLFVSCVRRVRQVHRAPVDTPDGQRLSDLAEGIEIALWSVGIGALFAPVAYQFYFYYLAGLAVATGVIHRGLVSTGATEPPLASPS